MIDANNERFRLTIPLSEAIPFAMGTADLNYPNATAELRQLVGLLVIDTLEYAEEWRTAAIVRSCLEDKWPGFLR